MPDSPHPVKVQLWKFPEGGLDGYPPELGYLGWSDSKLCQTQGFPIWWAQQEEALRDSDHDKVVILKDGQTLGGIVLVPGVDAQVGPALLAWHQFLNPHHRGSASLWRKVLMTARQAAAERGLKWLIWTHRDESSGRIFYTYKEVTPWVES